MKIGIISGHALPGLMKNSEHLQLETPYGDVQIEVATIASHTVFFIPRHSDSGNLPPHKVRYRANIQAFAVSHVDCILSLGTVGSMKKNIAPGDIVVPHDFLDFTKTRPYTFYDEKRVHVDMTNPFCPSLRDLLIQNINEIKKISSHTKGIYLTTEGPRLETTAEIQFFSKAADIVGMTVVPEVILAREKNICYASLCIVCNMATGLQEKLSAQEIKTLYREKEPVLTKILQMTIESIEKKQSCSCHHNLLKATL